LKTKTKLRGGAQNGLDSGSFFRSARSLHADGFRWSIVVICLAARKRALYQTNSTALAEINEAKARLREAESVAQVAILQGLTFSLEMLYQLLQLIYDFRRFL